MFLAIFVITFIILILIELILEGYDKYKMWRRYNEDYEIIMKTLPFIENIIAIKNNIPRGEIYFNDLYYEYNNKEELILSFKHYIYLTLKLYDEISENPLFSVSLEEKNYELKEIKSKISMLE